MQKEMIEKMEKHHKEWKEQIEKHEKELAEALASLKLERSHRERLEEELGSQRLQLAQFERMEKDLRAATPQILRDSEVRFNLSDLLTPYLLNTSLDHSHTSHEQLLQQSEL